MPRKPKDPTAPITKTPRKKKPTSRKKRTTKVPMPPPVPALPAAPFPVPPPPPPPSAEARRLLSRAAISGRLRSAFRRFRPNRFDPTDEHSRQEWQHLALASAYQTYLTRPDITVEDAWDLSRCVPDDESSPKVSEVMTVSALRHHAKVQRWTERRRKHFEAIRAQIEKALRDEAVATTVAEIKTLEALKPRMLDQIGKTPAKTMEGAVTAFVKLDERIQQKRESLTQRVAGAATGQRDQPVNGGGGAETVGIAGVVDGDDFVFTAEEIEQMAAAAARQRMEEANAALVRPALTVGDNPVGIGGPEE